jgi:alkylated DNA repair dioxygenase AlkB
MLVFTPDMDDVPLPDLDQLLAPAKRSVSSVGRGEWVSLESLIDIKRVEGLVAHRHGGRSPEPARLLPGEKPAKLADDGESWEESRLKTGLKLLITVPEGSTSSGAYVVMDEERRSFAGLLRAAVPLNTCQDFFERIRDGTPWMQPEGKVGLLPRKTCWMVRNGCSCSYRYGGIEVDGQEFPPWMLEVMQTVMPLCGLETEDTWPNSCNLNLYEDGGMSVGWHADDERLFQGRFQDCRIISLSLGARRRFELRLNWPENSRSSLYRLELGCGDILTMEGMMQKHFQHRVPHQENVDAPRINLTWRWVAKHEPRCPAERSRKSPHRRRSPRRRSPRRPS